MKGLTILPTIKFELVMKKILLALVVVVCGTAVSAQSTSMSTTKSTQVVKESGLDDKEIADALMKDQDVQRQTIRHLQSQEETRVQMGKISQSTDGSVKAMMAQVIKNEELTKAAVAFVKTKPELMKKVQAVTKK